MKFSLDKVAYVYKSAYYNLPQSMKTFFGTLYGAIPVQRRYGPLYTHYLEFFRRFEDGSDQFKEDYLYYKTLETLLFAQKYIPFYQKRFAEFGVSVEDFKSLDDLKKFPTLTKSDIINHIDTLYTDIVEKPIAYYEGTVDSKKRAKIYHSLTHRAKHKAYAHYTRSYAGYSHGDRCVVLKGRELADPKRDIYWEYEPLNNAFNIDARYILSDKFTKIYHAAKKFKPKFLYGYPSAVLNFMYACNAHKLEPLKVSGIILVAESVYDEHIRELKSYFGDIPVFIDYGQGERVVGAYRLDFWNYNFLGAYGLSRVVDQEIVGTSLDNFVMPLINYKTEDVVGGEVVYLKGSDIITSAGMIQGKREEYLVTDNYDLVPITELYVGHNLPQSVMINLAYQQKKPGRVTVLIEKRLGFITKEEIASKLKSVVKKGIEFHVKMVDQIPRNRQGKRIVCRQMLDLGAIKQNTKRKMDAITSIQEVIAHY